MKFDYSTRAQNLQVLRELFKNSTGFDACKIASFLSNLTNAELTAIFGVSGTQLTNLKSRLSSKATLLNNVKASAGE